jgi:hypothetical protein
VTVPLKNAHHPWRTLDHVACLFDGGNKMGVLGDEKQDGTLDVKAVGVIPQCIGGYTNCQAEDRNRYASRVPMRSALRTSSGVLFTCRAIRWKQVWSRRRASGSATRERSVSEA